LAAKNAKKEGFTAEALSSQSLKYFFSSLRPLRLCGEISSSYASFVVKKRLVE